MFNYKIYAFVLYVYLSHKLFNFMDKCCKTKDILKAYFGDCEILPVILFGKKNICFNYEVFMF